MTNSSLRAAMAILKSQLIDWSEIFVELTFESAESPSKKSWLLKFDAELS